MQAGTNAIRVTEKRLPQVQHFGNISGLHGAKLPPVDIITFGSPCQDMSIAGKRTGLNGSRSSLFHEAIRIIREMRCASNGKYPRYIVWEKRPRSIFLPTAEKISAVSSKPSVRSKTAAFQFLDLRENGQKPERFWQNPIPSHGEFLMHNTGVCPNEENGSFLSQILTEQAPEILFESEGLSGYSAESLRAWQRTAGSAADSFGTAGLCLCDQGGERIDILKRTHCHPSGRSPSSALYTGKSSC